MIAPWLPARRPSPRLAGCACTVHRRCMRAGAGSRWSARRLPPWPGWRWPGRHRAGAWPTCCGPPPARTRRATACASCCSSCARPRTRRWSTAPSRCAWARPGRWSRPTVNCWPAGPTTTARSSTTGCARHARRPSGSAWTTRCRPSTPTSRPASSSARWPPARRCCRPMRCASPRTSARCRRCTWPAARTRRFRPRAAACACGASGWMPNPRRPSSSCWRRWSARRRRRRHRS